MKQIILIISLIFICNTTFSQTKGSIINQMKVSIITPGKDTLYLVENELGNLILKLWINDSSYTSIHILNNGSKYDAWRNHKRDQKPYVIVMIDEHTFNVKKHD